MSVFGLNKDYGLRSQILFFATMMAIFSNYIVALGYTLIFEVDALLGPPLNATGIIGTFGAIATIIGLILFAFPCWWCFARRSPHLLHLTLKALAVCILPIIALWVFFFGLQIFYGGISFSFSLEWLVQLLMLSTRIFMAVLISSIPFAVFFLISLLGFRKFEKAKR